MAIGFKGVKEDLLIRQGADYGPTFGTIKNPDGTPFDLTGCDLSAVVCKVWNQSAPSMELTITITDAANGKFKLTALADETLALQCGESESDPKSQYLWQFDAREPSGRITPLASGQVSVFRKLASPV